MAHPAGAAGTVKLKNQNSMKTKVLHYAARRKERIIAAYKDVTFINKYVGWYVAAKDERHENWDNIAIVERIDGICFVAEFLSRNAAFDKEHLAAVEAEARNLRAAMQERIAQKQWIPLTYIAAYEALGWDARPLKEHRDYMQALYTAETREQERLQNERKERWHQLGEQERKEVLLQAERDFEEDDPIDTWVFIALCDKYGIKIHPRTLGLLRTRIAYLSRARVRSRGTYRPSLKGCCELIERLTEKLHLSLFFTAKP